MAPRGWVKVSAPLTVLLLLLSVGFPQAVPEAAPVIISQQISTPTPQQEELRLGSSGDDSVREVGTEWIVDYPWPTSDLPNCDDSAKGLVDKLTSKGWSLPWGRYSSGYPRYGNRQVWKSDFTTSNNSYVDDVDLIMFHGHGASGWDWTYWGWRDGPYLTSWHPDRNVLPGGCRQRWGDKDLEWIALHGCSILSDRSRASWASAMNGVHLILGYKTSSYNTRTGGRWASYMVSDGWWDPARTIMQAWFDAADDLQHTGVVARVLAESWDNFNDHIWGQGYVSPDPPVDNWYYYWDHRVGSEPPLQVSPDLEQMMLYEVVPTEVNTDTVRDLGAIFGLVGDVVQDEEGWFHMTTISRTLRVSPSGGFAFEDLSRLWVPSETPPALPSPGDAELIATNFLAANNLLPDDAFLFETVSETLAAVDKTTDEVTQTMAMDWQVIYARHLENSLGEFSVIGPGARLKVHVGEGGEIIGLNHVWRQVQQVAPIPIQSEDWARQLLADYGGRVVLGGLPYADAITITNSTLGYYELANGEEQDYLIPVYIFDADFVIDGQVAFSRYIAIPADQSFLSPVPSINTPTDGSIYAPGETITFTASTSFGTPPYAYTWSSSVDGFLGTGNSISVSTLSVAQREGQVVPHAIIATVMDGGGKIGTTSISVMVCEPVAGADFEYTPPVPAPSQPVTFTGTVTAGSGISSYTWDFGDNSTVVTGTVVSHTYAAAGDYTVVMTATNACGSATHSEMVAVQEKVYLPLVMKR